MTEVFGIQPLASGANRRLDDECVEPRKLPGARELVRVEARSWGLVNSNHSLRALGIFLYTKMGYPDEYIMALSGHAREQMKNHYFEGHEKPQPVRVQADLNVSDLDLGDIDWETSLSPELRKIADQAE